MTRDELVNRLLEIQASVDMLAAKIEVLLAELNMPTSSAGERGKTKLEPNSTGA